MSAACGSFHLLVEVYGERVASTAADEQNIVQQCDWPD